MSNPRDVAVIVGSLRKGSFNRLMANALSALAPASLKLEIVELRELSMYDQDLDEKPPQPWVAFRDRIRRADALLFLTPEYNRSVPGMLKNAIDIGSRPYGKSAWNGKPGAVMSVTVGGQGAFGANHHLRQSLMYLNIPTMPQPEAYIGNAASLFDATGALSDEKMRETASRFIQAFAVWVEIHAKKS